MRQKGGTMTDKPVIAVIGVSEDTEKYGHKIFKTLKHDGEHVYGVNPKGGTVLGDKIYPSLSELPEAPQKVIMVISPFQTTPVVEECIKLKVPEIWFQPGTENPKSIKFAKDAGINVIEGCFMVQGGYW